MDEPIPTPTPAPPTRWYHLALLLLLLIPGAQIRFHRLSSRSLWMDEYWSLYLSTARGQPSAGIFDAPKNVLLDPPPATNFDGAPPWWRIWTGMSSAVHPPLYHIALRWWVDLFGDSDVAIRSLSAILGLLAVFLFFEIVARDVGPWPALLASGLMLFSIAQIDLSCETRSYTMLICLGLLAVRTMLAIERQGVSTIRLMLLGFLTVATALTHYFGVGFLAGLCIYGLLRLKPPARTKVFATFLAAGAFVAITWGPFFWSGRKLLVTQTDYPLPGTTPQIIGWLAALPSRMILSPVHLTWLSTLPLAVLVFISPPFLFRRVPQTRLWYLWLLGGVGFVVLFDLIRQTLMVSLYKLVLPAGPAMYAIVAAQPPAGRGPSRWRAPLFIFIISGAIIASIEKTIDFKQLIPPDRIGLIYVALIALAVCLFIAGLKKSWAAWVILAVLLTIALHITFLSAGLSITMVIFLLLLAFPNLATSAPQNPCPWLFPLTGVALLFWSILTTCQWIFAGSVIVPKPDWRLTSRLIDQHAASDEPLAFTACQESNPAFCFIVYSHYSPASHRPVILLSGDPLSPQTLKSLTTHPRLWLIGSDPQTESAKYFPNWKIGETVLIPGGQIWSLSPPQMN